MSNWRAKVLLKEVHRLREQVESLADNCRSEKARADALESEVVKMETEVAEALEANDEVHLDLLTSRALAYQDFMTILTICGRYKRNREAEVPKELCPQCHEHQARILELEEENLDLKYSLSLENRAAKLYPKLEEIR